MACAEQCKHRVRTAPRLAKMKRDREVKAAIVAVFFLLALWGFVHRSMLQQRESEKLEAGWEVLQGRLGRGWDNGGFAVGFHLGHSYLYVLISTVPLLLPRFLQNASRTAVAWFRNGTTVNLAKVDGSLEYKLAMEAAIKGENVLHSYEMALAEYIDKLADVSESRLGEPIRDFELAAPWLEIYSYPTLGHDIFTRALRLTRAAANRPPEVLHVSEAAAVNVANGRQHCTESYCVSAGHWGPFRRLCYIRYVKTANESKHSRKINWNLLM